MEGKSHFVATDTSLLQGHFFAVKSPVLGDPQGSFALLFGLVIFTVVTNGGFYGMNLIRGCHRNFEIKKISPKIGSKNGILRVITLPHFQPLEFKELTQKVIVQ